MKKILSILLMISFCGGLAVASGNGESRRDKRKSAHRRGKNSSPKSQLSTTVAPSASPTPAKQSEPQLNFSTKDYDSDETSGILSGNQIVNINSSSNVVIKIGLAPHGIALIDFPANDPIYEIHPADENYVTVGCRRRESTTDQNKVGRCLDNPADGIILRPGTAFNQFASDNEASTIVTIQRVSGLVATVIVFPVKKITQNSNYVAFRYDAQKVAQSRASAGLSFNLNIPKPDVLVQGDEGVSRNPLAQNTNPNDKNFIAVKLNENPVQINQPIDNLESDLSANILSEMRNVVTAKPLLKFSKPVHGLALALAKRSSRLADYSIEVVAVKNTLGVPLRLIPEQPNLVIESIGEKEKSSVLSQDVAVVEIAATAGDEDILLPGEIYYFAFAYKSPILGARQNLKASFAHRAAADEPAVLLLNDLAK